MENHIGEKFNKLTIIEKTSRRTSSGNVIYKCRCDCGNITFANYVSLKNGHKKSCGCIRSQRKRKDLIGKKFGRLTVIKYVGVNTHRTSIWECKCDCGNIINVLSSSLLSGNTTSCGCITQEKISKEGAKNRIDNTNVSIIKSIVDNNKSNITKSGVKGVSWDKRRNRWRVYIMFQRRYYHLGYFKNKEDAIRIRKNAEEKIFGGFLEWYSELKKVKKNK